MPWLKRGRELVSDVTKRRYKVISDRVAQGGFGEVYRGVELNHHHDPCKDVAIKVSRHPIAWHGEAYFGRLLVRHPNVVKFIDAFPVVDGVGAARLVKYVLVLEWMAEGTVDDLLASGAAWSETKTVGQMSALLKALVPLHHRSICHGDITPRNVFVRKNRLLLGDLGIAKQSLRQGPIAMHGAAPDDFTPLDTPRFYWSPSDDVFQVALLGMSLMCGRVITSSEVNGKLLKQMEADDATKGWLHDALARSGERFADAEEALLCLSGEPVKSSPAPHGLNGQHVVFTGILDGTTRTQAEHFARHAGAVVQNEVNGSTTLVVSGRPNPRQIGRIRGKKLFDAYRRIRRGQRIAIIDQRRFDRLVERS